MRTIVFDIETANIFQDIGSRDPALLTISIVGAYNSETDTYSSYSVPELPRFWKLIESTDALVGFNSDHFDIPLLNKYYPGDLTHIKSIDLLAEIKKSLGRRIGLDAIAEATLGKKKSSHGLQATVWWKAGEEEKVREYCLDDVRLTKELYDYVLKEGHLKYKDFNTLREIKIDTSNWITAPSPATLTHTLPW